jgi:hypothetical protein
VKDCENGTVRFKPQKQQRKERIVPIHSALVPVVDELIRGKGPNDTWWPWGILAGACLFY